MAISMSALESGDRLSFPEHRDAFPASASIDRSRPIGEQVYRLMRISIISWRLQPGDSVSESIVTDRFDISRTPVREAFRQLAAEGLLLIRPQAGTFVSAIDRVRWNEGRIVRRALETEAIKLAATRVTTSDLDELDDLITKHQRAFQALDFDNLVLLDDKFHSHICGLSGLPNLWQIIDGAKAQFDRTRYVAVPKMGREAATIAEHRQIRDALAQRNPELSASLLLAHIDRSDNATIGLFGDKQTYVGRFA